MGVPRKLSNSVKKWYSRPFSEVGRQQANSEYGRFRFAYQVCAVLR
jgi:hypothetical protein